MATLASIKLASDLVEAARTEGALLNRSIAGQVEHWVKLGRSFEKSPGITLDRVRAALEGRFDAALLTDDERDYFDDAFGEVPTVQAANFWANFDRSVNTDL